jgi:hypothetical protein
MRGPIPEHFYQERLFDARVGSPSNSFHADRNLMPHRFMTDGPLQPRSPGEEHALTAKYEAPPGHDDLSHGSVRFGHAGSLDT